MISSVMTITARVAVTGFLTVSCFKRTVVDNTAQVLSEAEKVSAGLVAYSVCMSTITLVLAADAAAQRILSNDAKHMPAAPKDDDAGFNPPSTNDNTTSPTPNTVKLHRLQPSLSPPPSRLIESQPSPAPSPLRLIEPQPPSPAPSPLRLIEPQSSRITCCTCTPCINLTSPNLYCKRLSIDSDTTLLPCDDDFNADVFLDDASETDDCESFDDESTVHEDDHSEPQPLDILLSLMNALTLDDPPRPSKLRPLILVANRNTTTTIPYPPLPGPEPAYPMDALTRRMEARSLSYTSRPNDPSASLPGCTIDALTRSMEALSFSDRPSSTSKLRPLILVTKRAAGRHKPLAPTNTLLRQPTIKSTTRSQTYWPYSLSPTTWSPPAQVF